MKPLAALTVATALGSALIPTIGGSAGVTQIPVVGSTTQPSATQPRVWQGSDGYAEALGESCTATYNGKTIKGTLYSKPALRSEDLPPGQGDILDDVFVADVPVNEFHSYWKDTINGIPFGEHPSTWAFGGNFRLGSHDKPFVPFTREQLQDEDLLEKHKNDTWHGTYWAAPYNGPCTTSEGDNSKCYEETEIPVTLTGPVQEFAGRAKNDFDTSLIPMTIEFDDAVPPTKVAMLRLEVVRSCAFKTKRSEDGTIALFDPKMVATTQYDTTVDQETGQTRYVSDVWEYDLVCGGDDKSGQAYECPSAL